MENIYKKIAKYYDLCNEEKDYSKEANFIKFLIDKNNISGKKILDVGCGTCQHGVLLEKMGYKFYGVDLHEEMLEIAQKKSKNFKLFKGEIINFKLNEKFGVILCLYRCCSTGCKVYG